MHGNSGGEAPFSKIDAGLLGLAICQALKIYDVCTATSPRRQTTQKFFFADQDDSGTTTSACFGACRLDWQSAARTDLVLAENDVANEAQNTCLGGQSAV